MSNLDDIEISAVEEFETLPAGVYPTIISKIEKIEAKKFQSEEMETVLKFEFTILDGEYEGRKIFQRVRPKWAMEPKPSYLVKIVSAALPKKGGYVKDDREKFHLSSLLNLNVVVMIEVKVKGDKTFSNITGYAPLSGKS